MSTFLTARWEMLILANYQVDPAVLQPFLPAGTELDDWNGRHYLSLVGFLFLDTKVMGLSIPFHRNFEEVNLRFYVRYQASEGDWRRGVVFIRELVPRPAIAWTARTLYGEPYWSVPMEHLIERQADQLRVSYRWKYAGRWHLLSTTADPQPGNLEPGSEGEFITEHYWGYTRRNEQRTDSYQVEHPSWRLFPVRRFDIDCDFRALYGPVLAPFLETEPVSVMLAEGSGIKVGIGGRVLERE